MNSAYLIFSYVYLTSLKIVPISLTSPTWWKCLGPDEVSISWSHSLFIAYVCSRFTSFCLTKMYCWKFYASPIAKSGSFYH